MMQPYDHVKDFEQWLEKIKKDHPPSENLAQWVILQTHLMEAGKVLGRELLQIPESTTTTRPR